MWDQKLVNLWQGSSRKPGEDGEQRREEDDQVAQVLQTDVQPTATDERGVVEHLKYKYLDQGLDIVTQVI